ncbi:MAG TPA: nitroreductase [Actinomycetes bacterium]|nr:nitroreductase [Actinomycetes bacterium]
MLETRTARLLDGDVATALVEAASAAPSVHNSQPWIFTVGERTLDLHADPARHLAVSDGSGRSLLISCGAALFNLRVAADHLGFHPRVRILPTKDDPTHVARLEVDHRHGSPGFLEDLFPAVWSRRTNRFPFWNRRIPRSVLSRLHDAVSLENSLLRIVDQPAEVARIVALLHDAERADPPEAKQERAAWLGRDGAPDGIPDHSLGLRPQDRSTPFRDLRADIPHAAGPPPAPAGAPRTAPFEAAPTVAVLSTLKDTPADWVRAGQALERSLLVATVEGLSASFMNQPLEQHDLRWQVRSPLTGVGVTQMIMRLGYGVPVPATPRRPVSEVLRLAD